MNIGILGWYGYQNTGDDLILDTLLKAVKELDPESTISVTCNPKNILLMKELYPDVTMLPRTVYGFFKSAYADWDVLIFGGGGFFPYKNSLKILCFVLISALLKLRGKKVGIIGMGLASINFTSFACTALLKIWIRLCNICVLRHSIQPDRARWTTCFLKRNRYIPSADLLFSSYGPSIDFSNKHSAKTVVLAMAHIFESSEEISLFKFVNEISALIKHILSCGYNVKLLPFTVEIDQKLHDLIAQKVNDSRCISLPYDPDHSNACRILAESDFAVCMRFHAAVLSILSETPCYAISYGDKVELLMAEFELSDYCKRFSIDKSYYDQIEYLNSELLIDGFERICKDKDKILNNIRAKQKYMRDLADKNIEGIRQLLS